MTSDMQNPSSSDNGESAGESAGGSTGAATRNSGLPMRGLAMILIAVAVLLAAWALWSMLGDSDESVTAETATTAAETTENTGSTDATGTADAAGSTDATVASESRDAAREAEEPQESTAPEKPRDGERADQPAPAAGEPAREGDRAAAVGTRPAGAPVTTLHVLNNSTVPQLAARVAESLEPDFEKVESGNLPDVVIPRNTVYFTEGNPGAEQAARELADRVNGVAMERTPVLPEETGGKDALVLVLVEDVNL